MRSAEDLAEEVLALRQANFALRERDSEGQRAQRELERLTEENQRLRDAIIALQLERTPRR